MPHLEPLPYLLPGAMPLDVAHEGRHLIVLNKPAGLTCTQPRATATAHLGENGRLHHCPDLAGDRR